MLRTLLDWLHDPFNKKQIKHVHEPILVNMTATTERAKEKLRPFPIGSLVGNQQQRGDTNEYYK